MKQLAIETSSTACSVALAVGESITSEHVVEPRAHTQILVPMIDRLLGDAGLVPSDLDAVVLGNGPGSFIGMRIGASVAQGICFAAGIELVPISSLAAIAAQVFADGDDRRVVVTQDARMNEVYVGVYDRHSDGLPAVDGEEYIAPASDLSLADAPFVAAGGGWQRYPETIARYEAQLRGHSEITEPSAHNLLEMVLAGEGAAIAPASLQPAYLRHRVAEPPSSRN